METKNITKILLGDYALILGAGASMDYDFPSWGKLKSDIEERLNEMKNNSSENIAANYWLDELDKEENQTKTIDAIIEKSDFDESADISFIISLMSKIILDYEFKDVKSQKVGWIEKFVELIFSQIEKKDLNQHKKIIERLSKNYTITTLNYDRCLEHRISSKIKEVCKSDGIVERIGQNYRNKIIGSKIYIDHLHGAVGLISSNPPNDNTTSGISADSNTFTISNKNTNVDYIPYGKCTEDYKLLTRIHLNGDSISTVDQITKTYDFKATQFLNAKKTIVLGISAEGFINLMNHADFQGREYSEPEFVFFSGEVLDVTKIRESFPGIRIVDTKGYANDFVEWLSKSDS